MHKSTLIADRLAVSVEACNLFVAAQTTSIAVADIAEAVGISRRSFHRYFPNKADVVEPLFQDHVRLTCSALDSSRSTQIRSVLLDAHDAIFVGPTYPVEALMRLVFADRALWSVYLRAAHEGERTLLPHLASRLLLGPDAPRARAAATAFVGANKSSLESAILHGLPSRLVFLDILDAYGPELFRSATPRISDLSAETLNATPASQNSWQ